MVALPAVLTWREATAWAAQWQQAVASGAKTAQQGGDLVSNSTSNSASYSALFVFDAQALQRFDTAALAVLLDCRRRALALGKTLMVHGMAPRLQDLARLYGVDDLLFTA